MVLRWGFGNLTLSNIDSCCLHLARAELVGVLLLAVSEGAQFGKLQCAWCGRWQLLGGYGVSVAGGVESLSVFCVGSR